MKQITINRGFKKLDNDMGLFCLEKIKSYYYSSEYLIFFNCNVDVIFSTIFKNHRWYETNWFK